MTDYLTFNITGPALVNEVETTATAAVQIPVRTFRSAASTIVARWPGLPFDEVVNATIVMVAEDPLRYVADDRQPFIICNLRGDYERDHARELGLPDKRAKDKRQRVTPKLNAPVPGLDDDDADTEVIDHQTTTVGYYQDRKGRIVPSDGDCRRASDDGWQDGRGVDPAVNTLTSDIEDAIEEWLAGMPEPVRAVAELRYHEPDLTYVESAKRLGISEKAVTCRLAKAAETYPFKRPS